MNISGGSAFPTIVKLDDGTELTISGMDLRDYFAAKAMQAIVSKYGNEPPFMDKDDNEFSECPSDSETARWSYEIADALMKRRET